MYYILGCPDDGWQSEAQAVDSTAQASRHTLATNGSDLPCSLHMQQQRSAFPEEGRGALIAMLGLCFAATIIPAIKGYYLVPAAVLMAMAALVLALEYFQRQPIPSETVEFGFDRLFVHDHMGSRVELPTYWTRLEESGRSPYMLRLFLRCHDRRVEIGRCLGIEERAEVAPIIRAALARIRGEAA